MKPGPSAQTDEAIDRYWTVYGEYRDEEFPDGGILEGDFVGVFYASTVADARTLAHEYHPWLLDDSLIVEPGAAKGAYLLFPDSQRGPLGEEPELT